LRVFDLLWPFWIQSRAHTPRSQTGTAVVDSGAVAETVPAEASAAPAHPSETMAAKTTLRMPLCARTDDVISKFTKRSPWMRNLLALAPPKQNSNFHESNLLNAELPCNRLNAPRSAARGHFRTAYAISRECELACLDPLVV
jgi:hypothetical protein